jgi:NPCBM/NEW2 domain
MVAAGLAMGAAAPAGAESILLADGRQLTGVEMKAGPTPDKVVLERGLEGPLTVGKDEILVVDFNKTAGKAVTPSLRLLTGDQFVGKVTFPGGRQVKVGNSWGSVTLPFTWCSSIRLAEKTELPAPGAHDAVLLTNGDRPEGEIVDVKEGKLTLRLPAGVQAAIDLERVKAITFARAEPPVDAGSGLQVALDLGASERLTARWAGLQGENLKLQPAWGGTLEIPLLAVSRLEVKNGKLVYVSDLKPAEATQIPYLDGEYPHRANQTVGGRPLRLAGKTFRRGLGVHSRSLLKYTLDGKFKTFASTLGVDSEVGSHGSVVFRVYGDDKVLFESPVVHGGDDPIEISLDVSGVIALRLEVDYADNGDVADHADWADARLLRP